MRIPLLKPHTETQHAMITHPGNVVAFCGRRFGKTDGYVQRMFYWMTKNPGLYWWVGLSWRSASLKRAWREVCIIAREVLSRMGLPEREHINRSRFEIVLPGMGEIWFRTADNPSSLAGEGVHGVVMDEFSLMAENVWTEYIEATLLDYNGWVAFAGVPKGNNWAAHIWRDAPNREGWLQVHATSYDNPFIRKELIDNIRATAPEMFFNQEYMAQIVDDAGGVFRGVSDMATAEKLDEPQEGRQYVAGVDPATVADFTAVKVLDVESRREVFCDRFNRISYEQLEDRLVAIYKRFNLTSMVVEINGIGREPVERLTAKGLNITPFTTTHVTKQAIILDLASAFEHREISILPDPITIGELQSYQGTRTKAGGWAFSAPDGMHDDTVMALALAWHGLGRQPQAFTNPFYEYEYATEDGMTWDGLTR